MDPLVDLGLPKRQPEQRQRASATLDEMAKQSKPAGQTNPPSFATQQKATLFDEDVPDSLKITNWDLLVSAGSPASADDARYQSSAATAVTLHEKRDPPVLIVENDFKPTQNVGGRAQEQREEGNEGNHMPYLRRFLKNYRNKLVGCTWILGALAVASLSIVGNLVYAYALSSHSDAKPAMCLNDADHLMVNCEAVALHYSLYVLPQTPWSDLNFTNVGQHSFVSAHSFGIPHCMVCDVESMRHTLVASLSNEVGITRESLVESSTSVCMCSPILSRDPSEPHAWSIHSTNHPPHALSISEYGNAARAICRLEGSLVDRARCIERAGAALNRDRVHVAGTKAH